MYESCLMIEKVSLRPQPNQKFEILAIQLPEIIFSIPSISELGIYVPDNYQCLIFGGYSGQKSEKFVLKFTACQDSPETLTQLFHDEIETLKEPDFFSSMEILGDGTSEAVKILG